MPTAIGALMRNEAGASGYAPGQLMWRVWLRSLVTSFFSGLRGVVRRRCGDGKIPRGRTLRSWRLRRDPGGGISEAMTESAVAPSPTSSDSVV
jgi:hypothetical protein